MLITTWNVLHRVHAENWGELPVVTFPDEAARVAAVVARIKACFAAGVEVVALQEVGGDVLAALPDLPGVSRHVHRYPRVPHRRDGQPTGARDPHEHLVTLVRGQGRLIHAETAPSDSGKGLLIVSRDDGTWVVNVHLSHGSRGEAQLTRALELSVPAERVVVVGDFNATHPMVSGWLPEGWSLAPALPGGITRIGGDGRPGRWIDHVWVRGGRAEVYEVVDDPASDHRAVHAAVVWGAG
jgi:endonuclease/exonuclease/phosphatase family metal-dependent hydrolase